MEATSKKSAENITIAFRLWPSGSSFLSFTPHSHQTSTSSYKLITLLFSALSSYYPDSWRIWFFPLGIIQTTPLNHLTQKDYVVMKLSQYHNTIKHYWHEIISLECKTQLPKRLEGIYTFFFTVFCHYRFIKSSIPSAVALTQEETVAW